MTPRHAIRAALAVGGVLAACAPARLDVEAVEPPPRGPQSADPVVALDPATSDLLLAWVAGDSTGWNVYFARSADQGGSWSAPVRVTDREHDVHPHGETSPRLVAGPSGAVAVAWINSVPAPAKRWPGSNVRFARSADGGRTWSAAVTLNDDTTAGPAGHIFHGAALRGDSTLLVAWMDERGGAAPGNTDETHESHHAEESDEPDATVYLAESHDLGASWAANRPLWGAACPCCRIGLARGPRGEVVAAWRRHFPGNVRDVVVTALAAAPGADIRVHDDNWVYPGCPHTGPGVAVDPAGATHVTWYTGRPGAPGVFYARRDATGAFAARVALVTGKTVPTAHPRVAALPDGGALVASDVAPGGRPVLFLTRISAQGRRGGSAEVAGAAADHAELVALPDGGVIVAWTERGGGRSQVRMVRAR